LEPPRPKNASVSGSRVGERLVHDAVHEFNTPLTVIREFASILADGLCASGVVTQEECVRAILGASGDLVDMFDSYRGIEAVRNGRPPADRKPCSLPAIWEEARPAVERRAVERGVRLEADLDPVDAPLDSLDVDRRQVARALRCIIRAAIRSTPAGGRVRFRARRGKDGFVAFACLDGGPPLAPEDVRLFEQGEIGNGIERRSSVCTFGLDLELARAVAEANGGRLRLRSGPGGGRACLLFLPVVSAARSVDASRESRPRAGSLGRS